MNPKYLRKTGPKAHICPWCEQPSPKTGNRCGHLFKITANGVYMWYWGIRPVPNPTGLRSPRFGGDKQHPVVGGLNSEGTQ